LFFGKAEELAADAAALLFGIDGDPVQVPGRFGGWRRPETDIADGRAAVLVDCAVHDVVFLAGFVQEDVDQFVSDLNFGVGEHRRVDKDGVDAWRVGFMGRPDNDVAHRVLLLARD
jgi:hypothetical protein